MKNQFEKSAEATGGYDEVCKTSWGGFSAVRQGDRWGLVDGSFEILPCMYEEVYPFPNGCIGVKLHGKWGLVNQACEQLVPCIYDDVDGESSGDYVRVQLDGKLGLVYKDGKMALPCEYDEVDIFYGDYAPVRRNGKWGVVDEEGAEVFPCEYDYVEIQDFAKEGYARIKLDGRICYIHDNGEMFWD